MKYLVPVIVILFLLPSCKTQNLMEQSKKDTRFQHIVMDSVFLYNPNYEYRIAKDDKISMSIWNHEDLSVGSVYGIYNSNEVYGKWLLVDNKGCVSLPKIGKFNIRGLSVAEAEDSLKRIYARWVIDPVVAVKVLNKEITILGELRNPGKYLVEKDMNSLFDIVSRAGGFEMYANKKVIKIIRQKGSEVKMMNVDLTRADNYFNRNIQLLPGDVVVVPSKKAKDFEKRISTIIPLASSATAAAILIGTIL
jgi:polysaccharide biosynthesis/export protein